MNLDEAIKELQEDTQHPTAGFMPKLKEAEQLGIEALKWRQLMENDYGSWCGPLLPGQTKE